MVDFRPKAVPPEVQRQLKFKPQLQAKEDALKSVLDRQMRPLARLMLHLSKMAVSKVPEGPDKIEANLRHMMKLTELVLQRFWISFSEVVQARKSISFQALGMTEAESSKTDSYLNEADLLRIKEVVKHRARVQELMEMEVKLPEFSTVVSGANTDNVFTCRRFHDSFHSIRHSLLRYTVDYNFIGCHGIRMKFGFHTST